MSDSTKRLMTSRVVTALAAILFGLILIVRRKAAFDSLVQMLGVILMIGGVSFLLLFLFSPLRHGAQLFGAGVLGIVGLVLFRNPDLLVNLLPVFLGLSMVVSGVTDLGQALALRRAGVGGFLMVLLSLLVVVLGALTLLHPGAIANALALYMGITLLFTGVFNLVMLLSIRKL